MATLDLDKTDPTGDPDSVFCRHCRAVRIRHHGGLLCTRCDAPAHLVRP